MKLTKLFSDNRGAAVIEAAFALPVLVTLMIGILQFGLVLDANGTMRHAIGEGIRYAKVHPSATKTEVLDKVRRNLAGIKSSGVKSMDYTTGVSNGADFATISMSYELKPIIPFAAVPPIRLSATRTGYLPSGGLPPSSSTSTSTSSSSSSSSGGTPIGG